MRIILTHEQTDFDGIASLLAVHLIDEGAIPILPRKMNRNVHAFITLYGNDLPFVDPRDIGDQHIEFIYLVDTQSLTSIKGMNDSTKIHVIDHHSLRSDNPPNWDVRICDTGANVSTLVKEICERDIRLSVVEATLLLIGIYEDTGSLTYSRTTSQDIRAAADLLDCGANLTIVNEYINHPLSTQQQQVYDELRSAATSHTIHGYNILVAPGDARGMEEELSTIAHKLRDLIDPDAIIMLIRTRGGIQMIARSSKDDIDVSEIAGHFGGGGHPRAAAALIKTEDLESTNADLIQILPKIVSPAITVKEIMSGTPLLLSRKTPVLEVAKQMQKYGYEGYPVVEGNEILGLVTRRSVDRALSHRLNLDAESLMEAGKVSVTPNTSIEELQNLMTTTGWGQIPVVDSKTNKIIGIVTRTDLLEILSPSKSQNKNKNLANRLEKALPKERLKILKEIALIAQKQRVALYIVGGFVRDLLLGFPSLDFDLVVEGDAIALAKEIERKFGGRVTTHKRFGTAKWFMEQSIFNVEEKENSECDGKNNVVDSTSIKIVELPESLDFITARREFYSHPSALPTIERGSIKLDLHRRDFTINTLAIRLDGNHFGNLHDHWGGFNDIRQGVVRVLHSISFVDDPTRMLRAVRYEQRYGFQIGKRTHDLLLEARPLLSRVSGDRIRHEIDNIFKEDRAVQMMDRLNSLGLLKAIHKNLKWDGWVRDKIEYFIHPDDKWNILTQYKGIPTRRILFYSLWLIRLPTSQAEEVISRLRSQRIIKEIVKASCNLWLTYPELINSKESVRVKALEKNHPVAIFTLYAALEDEIIRESIDNYIQKWHNFKTYTSGLDLKKRGLPPGAQYKEILNMVKAAWIDGEIETSSQENEFIEEHINEYLKSIDNKPC